MSLLVLIAIILGMAVSIPLGILGAYMINRALEKGFWQGFFIASVGSFLDAIYCFVSLLGIYLIINLPWLRFSIQAIGLIFLTYVGYRLFLNKKERFRFLNFNIRGHKNSINEYLQDGAFVGIYYFLNPAVVAFWINASSVLHSSLFLGKNVFDQLLFSFFVGLGGLIISCLFLYLTAKARRNFLSASTIKLITAAFYLLTLAFFALYLIKNLVILIL